MVKICFIDGCECPYLSCSFLQDGVVRLCHRHRGSPSAFHERRIVRVSPVPVFSKHRRA